jgi:hypothetical protein
MLFGIMVYGTSWREEQCFESAPILNFSADPYLDSDHFETETLYRKTYLPVKRILFMKTSIGSVPDPDL